MMKKKRIGAALLTAVLVFSQLGATAYAVESPAGAGLCEHHPEHTAECGYVEAVKGHTCGHEHTPDCYTDELICGYGDGNIKTASDSNAGHTHTEGCYQLDCQHEHDDDCGYIEAVKGQPCAFVCEDCAGEPDKDSGKEEPTINGNDLTPPETTGPETVSPEGGEAVTVTAFDELDDEVKYQTVPAGTVLDDLILPATLDASGYAVDDDAELTPEPITITGVTWEPDSPWDDTAEQGGYTFTPILPAGYTLASAAELPEIHVRIGGAITFALQGDELTVEFNDNGSGGTSMDDNDMKTAIDAALASGDKANIATIKLTGDAAEITDWNWVHLIELYHENGDWNSLTALDLSDMTRLEAIRDDVSFGRGQHRLTKLKTLILPDNVEQIGNAAFLKCTEMTLNKLPDKLTQIGDYAFQDCAGITLNALPDGVTEIGYAAFYKCAGITLSALPDGVTKIGEWAFAYCTGITLNALPDGVTEIWGSAFAYCTGITLNALPDDVTKIGDYAFYLCTGITLNALPDGVTEIGMSAFNGCTGITLNALPDELTKIGENAFTYCTGITLNALPDGVTEIGHLAFWGCTGLDKIIMEPTAAPTLGIDAFRNTSSGLTFYVPKNGTGYDSGGWEDLNTIEYSPVTLISLPATLELRPNGSGTLTATFIPDDATFKDISWESSDTGVATVNDAGNVAAVSVGTATITATSRQGGKTATCIVTVREASTDAALKSLSLSSGTLAPVFDPAITSYTANVGNSVTNVTINATPNDTKATVAGDGAKSLAEGVNPFTVTVTAEDGSTTKNYTITVTRAAAATTGGSSSGGGSSHYTITTPEPNNPVLAVIELPVSVTEGKPATGKPDDGRTASAIAEAGRDAKARTNGIAVQYVAQTSTAYDGFSIVIQRATLDRLIAAKVKYVTLNTSIVDMTFDLAALQEIQRQTTGDITLTATRETGLDGAARAAVGSRPSYRLAVNYTGADGKAATVDSFGSGRVTVGLAYKPAENEQTGGLYLVYSADGKGAEWLYQSSYDRNNGNVIGSVGHFSVYGVGYKSAPAFADTVNHWARSDIDFVASRGLFSGTSETMFTPDGTITRGMFVTALGRLAGIDPAAYSSSQFNDIAATAYYAPYVEWAVSTGIVSGTGDNTFSPDEPITREQMAVIMRQYADKLGYTLPVVREAVTFTDDNQITGSMKDAVQRVQQSGIMSGKDNNRFGPKDAATRAEAAVVLRRFVEVVINRDTAGGWGQNDAGKWLYYENNKPVTGWKQVDGTWYYFDGSGLMQAGGWLEIGGKWYYIFPDGAMAVNTKIDGYEIGPDGVREEKKD